MARIAALALCACIPALLAGRALAATAVTIKPAIVHPKQSTQVSGSGFGAGEAVDVYLDSTDQFVAVADGTGKFAAHPLAVSKDALPGKHWITAIGRKTGDAVQRTIIVRTDWLQYGFEQHDRGRNPYENVIGPANAGTLDVKWIAHTGGGSTSAPAYSGGLIYVGSGANLDALTSAGKVKWSAVTGGGVGSSPAIANGNVYVGSNDGKVYAFNAFTGAPVWSVTTGGPIFNASPVIVGNTLYIGSSDGNVYALDTGTGATVWSTAVGTLESTPAVVNGIVCIPGTNDLVALDAATGAVLWTFPANASVSSSPAVANGMVYFGSADSRVHALRARDGSTVWTAVLSGAVNGSPAAVNDTVFIGSDDAKISALDAGTGALKWSTGLSGEADTSGVSIANGVGYIGDFGGRLTAFDLTSGAALWTANPTALSNSRPAIADGVLYMDTLGSTDGVYAFALDGGFNAAYRSNRPPPSYSSLHPDFRLKPSK